MKCDKCIYKKDTSLKEVGLSIGSNEKFEFCEGHFEPLESLKLFNFDFENCYRFKEKQERNQG